MISAAPSWSRTRLAIFMISASGRHSNTVPTGAARTSGGSSTSKREVGSGAGANPSLPPREAGGGPGGWPEPQFAAGVDVDGGLVPAGLAPDHLVDRQHVQIFVGE